MRNNRVRSKGGDAMWILDSLADVQMKKPFLILWISLGAAFLLLANLFSLNPVHHPATYSILALAVWLSWQKQKRLQNSLIVAILAVAAFFLIPEYRLVYAATFTLLIGKVVFAESFRVWKWVASAGLLFLVPPIVGSWQAIPEIQVYLPVQMAHLVHAAVLAFCVQFALIPFQLRKDSVIEAFGTYVWKTSGHAHRLASEMVALYTKIKTLIKTNESNPKIQQDLEDYTERAVHQCYRLQEITLELSNISQASLEQQIVFLTEKFNSVEDFETRMQYEQALNNKKKQFEQYEKLQMRQEHLLSRIINYNSSLENVRFAYANQDWQRSSGSNENVEMFMDLVKARAEAL
jgi:hypothetical protein